MKNLYARLDHAIRKTFARFGIALRRLRVHNHTATAHTPLTARYHFPRKHVLLSIPVENIRGFGPVGYPFSKDAHNPFVDTAELLRSGEPLPTSVAPLRAYYDSFKPANFSEVAGISKTASEHQKTIPPNQTIEPWSHETPSEIEHQRSIYTFEENKNAGVDLTIDGGLYFWGPVSPKKLETEHSRLTNLVSSVSNTGYVRSNGIDGDIVANTVLCDGCRWAIQIGYGHHRAAVLVALGFKTLPIRLLLDGTTSFIVRNEVEHWPHVMNGLYTVDQALSVFDRILDGRPSEGMLRYLQARLEQG